MFSFDDEIIIYNVTNFMTFISKEMTKKTHSHIHSYTIGMTHLEKFRK
ncbi:hypothetical protein HMPREF0373_03095 [Eubacterium ramulus ATCC 29099]|uniref:Uncharacterized protein n=1 Tax=Eubacterium ramulus ATCC 29099 TaxID=1256908 RepID=U2NUN6_EUBRA|nr:hypothetical protein HMPREF0373_03095 [Eubacterium ramulus ATCC 29099]